MKTMFLAIFAALLAAVSSSCTHDNYGQGNGNVTVDLGLGGILGLGGGYAPPPGLRALKGCPPGHRIVNRGPHRIVCDPRGRHVGFIPPQGYGRPAYAGSGGGYRRQPGYGNNSRYPRPRPEVPMGPVSVQGQGGTMWRGEYIDAYGGRANAGYYYR